MEIRFMNADENAHDTLFKLLQREGFDVDQARTPMDSYQIRSKDRVIVEQRESRISLTIRNEPARLEKQAFFWLDKNYRIISDENRNGWFYALFACAGWLILRSPSILETEPLRLDFTGTDTFTTAVAMLVINLLIIAIFIWSYLSSCRRSEYDLSEQAFSMRNNRFFMTGVILTGLLFSLAPIDMIENGYFPFLAIAPLLSLGAAIMAFRKGRLLHCIDILRFTPTVSA